MITKAWYTSKTLWVGVSTALAAWIPLVVILLPQLGVTDKVAAIVAAILGFILGTIQIVRRVFLDGDTTPPALG